MNTLDLKRKAQGWLARGTGDGTNGAGDGTNNGGDAGQGPSGDQGGGGNNGGDGLGAGLSSIGDPGDLGAAVAGGSFGVTSANEPGTGWGGMSTGSSSGGYNPNASPASNPAAAVHDLGTTTGMYNNDVSYGELRSAQKAGFGWKDASQTQTIDQALASKNFNDNIAPAMVGAITAAVPGAGLMMSGMRAAGRVSSGQTTLGDEAKNFAIDFAGNKVAGMINSQVAGVVGRDAYGALSTASSISKAFDGPGMPNIGASVVNGVLGAAGVTKSTGSGFASQNNSDADNGFTAPGTNYNGGDSSNTPSISTPVTPTVTDVLASSMQGADINLWRGMDGAGWTAAKDKYFSSKGK